MKPEYNEVRNYSLNKKQNTSVTSLHRFGRMIKIIPNFWNNRSKCILHFFSLIAIIALCVAPVSASWTRPSSAIAGATYTTYSADKAIDGKLETWWSGTTFSDANQWIEFSGVPDGSTVMNFTSWDTGIIHLDVDGNSVTFSSISHQPTLVNISPTSGGSSRIFFLPGNQNWAHLIEISYGRDIYPPAPVCVNFNAFPQTGSAPLSVQFTDVSTGDITAWNWSFGDGDITNSTLRNPTHTFLNPGNYSVVLTITNISGFSASSSSKNIIVTARDPPPANSSILWVRPSSAIAGATYTTYTADKAIDGNLGTWWSGTTFSDANQWIEFSGVPDNSTVMNFTSWDNGVMHLNVDGNTVTFSSISHQSTLVNISSTSGGKSRVSFLPGNQNWAHLIEISYGKYDSQSSPTANFIATPLSGTAPLTVNFTDTSTNSPTSWSWAFGDGANSTVQNPMHTYTAAGTYGVNLTATNVGGSNTTVKSGYVNVTSIAPVGLTYSMTNVEVFNPDTLLSLAQYPPHYTYFPGRGIISNLSGRLQNAGWQQIFVHHDAEVTKTDFGTTGGGLNAATFHYHFGHGNFTHALDFSGYIAHPSGQPSVDFDPTDSIHPSEMTWNGNLKWIIIDACSALENQDWAQPMGTTHGVLGFYSEKMPSQDLPNLFLQHALDDNDSVYTAYHDATFYSFTQNVTAAVIFSNSVQQQNDHLPGHGTVTADENPNNHSNDYYEPWSCGGGPTEDQSYN